MTEWKFEPINATLSSGPYTIISALDNSKVLDISGGIQKAVDGTNIQLWQTNNTEAQVWDIVFNEDDTYTLVNPSTKKVLDVSDAGTTKGTNIHLWKDNKTCAQKWKIIESEGYYTFISSCSDLVLDVNGGLSDNGANIQLW